MFHRIRIFSKTAFLFTALFSISCMASFAAGLRLSHFLLPAALLMAAGSFCVSGKIVLALHRARRVTEREAPELCELLTTVAQKVPMRIPHLYILPTAAVNALAVGTGPENAAVALTFGAMDALNREELQAVLALQITRIRRRGVLPASLAAALSGMMLSLVPSPANPKKTVWLREIARFSIWPLAAGIARLGMPGAKEAYEADSLALLLCENESALASTLQKMETLKHKRPLRPMLPGCAFLFTVNPILQKAGLWKLFPGGVPFHKRRAALERAAVCESGEGKEKAVFSESTFRKY